MTISDPNIHHNAPHCTILKKFLGQGGGVFVTCIFPNLKEKIIANPPPPPLPNPGYAPAIGNNNRGIDLFHVIRYCFLKSLRSENHTPLFHLFNRSIMPYIL